MSQCAERPRVQKIKARAYMQPWRSPYQVLPDDLAACFDGLKLCGREVLASNYSSKVYSVFCHYSAGGMRVYVILRRHAMNCGTDASEFSWELSSRKGRKTSSGVAGLREALTDASSWQGHYDGQIWQY